MLIRSICICFVLAIFSSCVMWRCDVYTQQISLVLGDSLHSICLWRSCCSAWQHPRRHGATHVSKGWVSVSVTRNIGCHNDIRGANHRPGYGYHYSFLVIFASTSLYVFKIETLNSWVNSRRWVWSRKWCLYSVACNHCKSLCFFIMILLHPPLSFP